MNKILLTLLFALLVSCGPSQKDFDKLSEKVESLESENNTLKAELDNYKENPLKLLSIAKLAFIEKDREMVNKQYDKLLKFHPESEELNEVKAMIDEFKREEEENRIKLEKLRLEEEKKRMSAVSKLKKKYDDVSGVTWYENPYFTHYNNSNHTSLYIGEKEGQVWLRLKMSYYGDSWIFFDYAYLSYDGKTHQIEFDKYRDKKTENDSSTWEWIDVNVDDLTLKFLKDMINGKVLKMRLSGKYTNTRNLSPTEVKAMKDVLLAYDVLNKGV